MGRGSGLPRESSGKLSLAIEAANATKAYSFGTGVKSHRRSNWRKTSMTAVLAVPGVGTLMLIVCVPRARHQVT
ncbi:hypothetical protein C7G43_12735 [Bradyrhizobium sp. MOS004]|jgi:hypothetical protein|nr:hypothetical protein C7G43_12735 [Bradyrhizobium sp. MOS004]